MGRAMREGDHVLPSQALGRVSILAGLRVAILKRGHSPIILNLLIDIRGPNTFAWWGSGHVVVVWV
jgi:hypothetical protein